MKRYAILITAIALGISSCAANQGMTQSSGDELRREIEELRAAVEASNAKLASLEIENRDIKEQKIRLVLLKKELDKNVEAVKELKKSAYEIKEPANLKVVKLQGIETGGADRAGVQAASPVGNAGKEAAGDPVIKKEKPRGAVSGKKPATKTPSVSRDAILKRRLNPLSTEELYDEGLKLYNGENYSSARTAFELLIEKAPRHNLADNALYWVAETYYAHTRYVKAIEVFKDVAKKYPESNKTPDSLLKIGYSYLELEDSTEAGKAFERLIDLHPDTLAAGKARERLKSLN